MTQVYVKYAVKDPIPVTDYLKNKKLKKYFNRETAAAVTAMGKLLEMESVPADTPAYYATGHLAYEDYGLAQIVKGSTINGAFSSQAFMESGLTEVSPLSQFKILQNMPLCFASIAFGLTGSNAVVYASAAALLETATTYAQSDARAFIVGAGKTEKNGSTEAGFILLQPSDISRIQSCLTDMDNEVEAISLFQTGGLFG